MKYKQIKLIRHTFATLILSIIVSLCISVNVYAEIVYDNNSHIIELWNKYYNQQDKAPISTKNYRVIGNANEEINNLIKDNWDYKSVTYELFFDNQVDLANTIYNLAIFAKDITDKITIERFQKGVQGFHYHINQICDWLNNSPELASNNDTILFQYLLEDNAIKVEDEVIVPTGTINHVLGIAYNPKRKMDSIAKHEQIHILWDEDPAIKDKYTDLWSKLTASEKEEVIGKLKGYSTENESQLIEEWAVREIEKNGLN
jgi:hypothetical protein